MIVVTTKLLNKEKKVLLRTVSPQNALNANARNYS